MISQKFACAAGVKIENAKAIVRIIFFISHSFSGVRKSKHRGLWIRLANIARAKPEFPSQNDTRNQALLTCG
jgi:hypothetical protein